MVNRLEEIQSGFRRENGTSNQIFIIRWISEKAIKVRRQIYFYLIEMKKAFDRIWRENVWVINTRIKKNWKNLIQCGSSNNEKTEDYERSRNEDCVLHNSLTYTIIYS